MIICVLGAAGAARATGELVSSVCGGSCVGAFGSNDAEGRGVETVLAGRVRASCPLGDAASQPLHPALRVSVASTER